MAMRLQEVHPSLVHFPLALLPLSVGADLLGRLTGNEKLLDVGRLTMPLAAASGLVAGVAGLMAQTEVKAEGESLKVLQTHRTLNLGLVAIASAMAVYRGKTERPGAAYLALGLAGIAVMTYSGYLGGAMVYKDGVGVEAAEGIRRRPRVPELTRKEARKALRTAATDTVKGVKLTIEETAKGELIPSITDQSA